jgi:hypothetical protein
VPQARPALEGLFNHRRVLVSVLFCTKNQNPPPTRRAVAYRLKTAIAQTAINTTTPEATIASSTFGIFKMLVRFGPKARPPPCCDRDCWAMTVQAAPMLRQRGPQTNWSN